MSKKCRSILTSDISCCRIRPNWEQSQLNTLKMYVNTGNEYALEMHIKYLQNKGYTVNHFYDQNSGRYFTLNTYL